MAFRGPDAQADLGSTPPESASEQQPFSIEELFDQEQVARRVGSKSVVQELCDLLRELTRHGPRPMPVQKG
jgi:hypothetical protein